MIPVIDPDVDAELFGGAAVIHMLSPTFKGAKTFAEYANYIFIPYILRRLEKVSSLVVVWNRYVPKSLKAAARDKTARDKRGRVADMLQEQARFLQTGQISYA